MHNEANVTNNLDSSSNEDLSIEDMQNRCVLKFKKAVQIGDYQWCLVDEDRREEYKLLFHPSAPNKINMTGLQMVRKQLFVPLHTCMAEAGLNLSHGFKTAFFAKCI